MPVVIYARVSTDNQVGGRFDSCDSQTAVCRDVLRQHGADGWHEFAALTDAAYSGSTMDRPGIKALMLMIEAGEVKIVLVYKLERISRNMDEWGPFRAFLKKHGCVLESATENISEIEPEGRLKNNIMMSVAEFERLNTAKKTRIKMREQAKRGYWNGGYVPYGYAYDKNTQSLQPHPQEAPLVRQVFEQASKLVSLTEVANTLNAAGHRTKERLMQRRDGTTETIGKRVFRSDGLRLLVRNPIYRGSVKFEGQEFAAKHEALVPADLWEKANAAVMHTNERPGRMDYPFQARDAHNHLFKGLAWCASCGRALVPSDSGKKSASGLKYRYYTCSLVLRESQTMQCTVGRLSADALEKAIIALLGEASKHPLVVKEMIEVSRSTRRGDTDVLRAELEKQKQSLAIVDKQLNNCADAVAKGGVEVIGEALVRRAIELRDQRRRLLFEQERTRQELAAANATVLEEQRISRNLERFGEVLTKLPPTEQKELVKLFIERIDVRRVLPSSRKKTGTAGASPPDALERMMEIRVKLHSAELARGVEERASVNASGLRASPSVSLRGLNLDARVDFKNAMRGEIVIIAPFRQTLRLESRVRTVPAPKAEAVHPIARAQKWQRMLASGEVGNRFALAKRVGVDPAMVTRVLKLVRLAPDIQEYLTTLRTPGALWHFNIRLLGELAELPVEKQRAAFARISARYDAHIGQLQSAANTVPIAPRVKPPWRSGPRLAAG